MKINFGLFIRCFNVLLDYETKEVQINLDGGRSICGYSADG